MRDAECAVLMLFLVAVGIHAMLELPLHYAYMLLPTGLVMGVFNTRHPGKTIVSTGRWALVAMWLASAVLLGLIVRDYFRVEASYQVLRFEWARIKTRPEGPPDVTLLTQWREFVRYARFEPIGDAANCVGDGGKPHASRLNTHQAKWLRPNTRDDQ